MLPKLSVVRLGGISIVGGIVAIFCAKSETKIKSNLWEQQPYCKESLELLKNHEGANYILGQEFAVKPLEKEDTADAIRFCFPVEGKDGKGMFTIYSTCIANTEEKSGRSCNVDKCFLEIEESKTLEKERYKDKQLVIYSRKTNGPMQYEIK